MIDWYYTEFFEDGQWKRVRGKTVLPPDPDDWLAFLKRMTGRDHRLVACPDVDSPEAE